MGLLIASVGVSDMKYSTIAGTLTEDHGVMCGTLVGCFRRVLKIAKKNDY